MKKSALFVLRWFPASIYISEPEMERHIYSPHSIGTEYSFNNVLGVDGEHEHAACGHVGGGDEL